MKKTSGWRTCIQSERGVALFLVLWALVLLSVIVGEFCFATRSEVKTTFNFKQETQAYYYARAGIQAAIYELLKQDQTPKKLEEDQNEDEETIHWNLTGGPTTVPFEGGAFTVVVENECGKVNINQAEETLLRAMVNGFNLSDDEKDGIVDSIIDWRDKDDFHRINGAESDYYQSLEKPYSAKNANFDFVSELLNVKGITPEIYYGGLKKIVSVWDDPEITEATPFSPIQQYLTLKNRPKNSMQQFLTLENRKKMNRKDDVDYNRIDINSAPTELLQVLPGMDAYYAAAVVETRLEKPFTSTAALINIVGSSIYNALKPYVAVQQSKYVTITSTGTVVGNPIFRTVQATIKLDDELEKGFEICQWQDDVFEKVDQALADQNRS